MKTDPPRVVRDIELEQLRSQLRDWKSAYERVGDHYVAVIEAWRRDRQQITAQLRVANRHLGSGNVADARTAIVTLLTTLQDQRGQDRQTLFDMQQERPGAASAA